MELSCEFCGDPAKYEITCVEVSSDSITESILVCEDHLPTEFK